MSTLAHLRAIGLAIGRNHLALRVACWDKGSDYFKRFNSVSVPDLNYTLFDKDLFTLRFAGTVRNVELGAIGDSSSAMPTYFEAAWAGSPASFLMGAVIYVLLALALIVRRPASPS